MHSHKYILKEFDDHRLVAFINDRKTCLRGFIVLHRGGLNVPSFGATRLYDYASDSEALRDALKLSRLMSYKAAMAGLEYGGAKGVIISKHPGQAIKKSLLKAYAEQVNYFGGHFITGADVGLDDSEVRMMRRSSPYFVGVKSQPVRFTALGLWYALRVCMQHAFNNPEVSGRSFAIQGVGKVGESLLRLIYRQAGKMFIADIDSRRLAEVKKKYPKVEIVSPSDIYRQHVDVFSPCALSNSLNAKSISRLRAQIVLGGANNQLENKEAGELMYKLGILYAPDYVVNAGGLISVVDEYEHKNFNAARISKRVENISVTLKKILLESVVRHRGTNLIADETAEKIFNNH